MSSDHRAGPDRELLAVNPHKGRQGAPIFRVAMPMKPVAKSLQYKLPSYRASSVLRSAAIRKATLERLSGEGTALYKFNGVIQW